MLGVPDVPLGIALVAVVVVGPLLWMWARVRHGEPALARHGRRTKGQNARKADLVRD
jgi:hypothetical protein